MPASTADAVTERKAYAEIVRAAHAHLDRVRHDFLDIARKRLTFATEAQLNEALMVWQSNAISDLEHFIDENVAVHIPDDDAIREDDRSYWDDYRRKLQQEW